MSWAVRRQLTILVIILAFIGFFAGLFFFLVKPETSCKDGKVNQGEEGIDCGGPCDRVCPNSVSDPIIKWSRVLAVRQGQYDTVAFIENQNPRVGLEELSYRFTLYDAKNNPVAERTGKTFLNPAEKMVIYEPLVVTGNVVPVKSFLELEKPDTGYLWKKPLPNPQLPNLRIRTKTFDDTTKDRVTAIIANDSLTDGRDITIIAVLYDTEGNAMGASSTYLDRIQGNSELPIVFTWPNPFTETPQSFDIYLHYDQGIVRRR